MIAIVDLGIGNISNVKRPLKGTVTDDPYRIEKADKMVIPGVGNFCTVKEKLDPLKGVISDFIEDEKPFLGICLGMQLLFGYNEEGKAKGLEILEGEVKGLDRADSPHIGWNTVKFESDFPISNGITDGSFFYFTHSYYVDTEVPLIGKTEVLNGDEKTVFPAVIRSGNMYGTQFHPEKSGSNGLRLLENFSSLDGDET